MTPILKEALQWVRCYFRGCNFNFQKSCKNDQRIALHLFCIFTSCVYFSPFALSFYLSIISACQSVYREIFLNQLREYCSHHAPLLFYLKYYWTVAYQAPQSMEFSRQEYWSGLPFPSPGDLPNPGIEPGSPALQAKALPSEPPGKPEFKKYLW